MKRFFSVLICVVVLLMNIPVFADVYVEDDTLDVPSIEAEAAILMDMKTGRVIYSKNADEKLYPASTTKILTGIMALELGKLDDVVTASIAALAPITNEDSHMGILIGEQLTMEQLINGMLVYSANDAANMIATHISGTSEHFVELMNQKAEELGAVNTHFTNSYGIQDEDHYTTAEDLGIISRYAMQNEKFREIVKQSVYNIPATNKYEDRILPSTNMFLGTMRSGKYVYTPVTGIKTGHTKDAGYCLVTSAQSEGTELLCVVLKCPNQDSSYVNTKALLQFGFTNYKYRTIAKSGDVISDSKVYEAKDDKRIAFTVGEDIGALLPANGEVDELVETVIDLPDVVKAPIAKGDKIGTVSYNYNGTLIGTADLVAVNEVKRNYFLFIFHVIVNVLTNPFFIIGVILLLIVLLLRRINIRKQERIKRKRRLHERDSNKTMRDGTKRPVNMRFEDNSNKKNSRSRYAKK